ncbi:ATP-binding protein [Bifidobacterium actinocoloniiforme]|uniref:ATP-binding protein n=1 Tax=Bifidobacterium actinocoloniiforme TaxID=638619 RepID=UPI0009DFA2DA|nr:ATP-binding protein [Bifidobacterium actinocoloniiforme]
MAGELDADASLTEVVKQVQRNQREGQIIEVKAAAEGTPRVYDSLSSFSNQNEGGFILFGIDEGQDFTTTGVFAAQQLKKEVVGQGEAMTPVVRPEFDEASFDGKTVVCAFISGLPMSQRSVYRTKAGITQSAYTRVNDADVRMSATQLYEIESFKDGRRDDASLAPDARMDMLDAKAVRDFVRQATQERPKLARRQDDEILELTGVTKDGKPTLADLMTLGDYPQQAYPNLCITASVVAGTELGKGNGDERFIDSKRFEGGIGEMIEGAMAVVRRNSKTTTRIRDGVRIDLPQYPETAVREILTNALMHRDYGPYCNGSPVRLTLFSDRLECTNPGGIYGGQSLNEFGFANSQTRNPTLVSLLEIEHIAENRHSGIPAIQEEARERGYKPVEFLSRQAQASFTVKFYSVADEPANAPEAVAKAQMGVPLAGAAGTAMDREDKLAAIVELCQTPQTAEDVAELLGIGKYYARRNYIEQLLREGRLAMTNPDRPRSRSQRFVAA